MVKQSAQPVLKKQRPRTCGGCGEEPPKRTLLRVIKAPDGEVRYDPTGKANGRGAYVFARRSCVQAAKKKRSFSRALKTEAPEELYAVLLEKCGEEEC